jgi:hypothetical protein
MITSIIGYIFGDNQGTTIRYKGIKFSASQEGWKTKYSGKVYTFPYVPDDLNNINFSSTVDLKTVQALGITYSDSSLYKEYIADSIFRFSNWFQDSLYVQPGFTENNSYSLPVITCADATAYVPVIYYKYSNQTQITEEGSCITIEASDPNMFLALTNKLAYMLLGIE